MNGVNVTVAAFMASVFDTNVELAAVGDANGDGKADRIWRNTVTGQNFIWFMNGIPVGGSEGLPGVTDVNWRILGS